MMMMMLDCKDDDDDDNDDEVRMIMISYVTPADYMLYITAENRKRGYKVTNR